MSGINETVVNAAAIVEGVFSKAKESVSKGTAETKESIRKEVRIARLQKERRELISKLGERAYESAPKETDDPIVQKIRETEWNIRKLLETK